MDDLGSATGVELRLGLDALGVMDRLGLEAACVERLIGGLGAAAVRLSLLEFPLFRELLAAQTGSTKNAKIQMQNPKIIKKVVPLCREFKILIFDL